MKLTVLSLVSHDGADYAEGATIDVKDEAQAQALITSGVALEVVVDKPKAKARAEATDKA